MTILEMPVQHAIGFVFPEEGLSSSRNITELKIAESGVILRSTIAPKSEIANQLVEVGLLPEDRLGFRSSLYLWLPKVIDNEGEVMPSVEVESDYKINKFGRPQCSIDSISFYGLGYICKSRPYTDKEPCPAGAKVPAEISASMSLRTRYRLGSATVEVA